MTLAHKYAFDAIGTRWAIDTDAPLTSATKNDIEYLIASFDKTYSRFRDDSLVRTAENVSSPMEFPQSIERLLTTYDTLNALSDGAINPLVGSSLETLGYDADYSLAQRGVSPAPNYSILHRDGSIITLEEPALLDVGAIGKGYLADDIAALLATQHHNYVVDASGDIAVRTDTPERIGLEDPIDLSRVIGVVELSDQALCASAPNRRAWGDNLHHIIDARTGLPIKTDIVATWAIADTASQADTLATGLFFITPELLTEAFGGFAYVIMRSDRSVQHTIDSIGEIFS